MWHLTYRAAMSGRVIHVLTITCHGEELSQFRCLFSIFRRTAKFSIRSLLCTSQGKWLPSEEAASPGRQTGHATKSLRKQGDAPLVLLLNPQKSLENSTCLIPCEIPEHNSKGWKEQHIFLAPQCNPQHSLVGESGKDSTSSSGGGKTVTYLRKLSHCLSLAHRYNCPAPQL